MNMPLVLLNRRRRGFTAFSPSTLFSSTAIGIWLDPSDLSTMFSDRAGTIPITTPGTVVGKRLDKSGRGNHATAPTDAARPIYGVEPKGGRRNLLTWSERFDVTTDAWAKVASSIGASVTAPNATETAQTLTEDTAATTWHGVSQPWAAPSLSTVTYTTYAKAATRRYVYLQIGDGSAPRKRYSALFDLESGTFVSANSVNSPTGTGYQISSAGNGWHRLSVTMTIAALANGVFLSTGISNTATPTWNSVNYVDYTGDGTSGIYIWGAQLELGSTATAYQRVTTAYDITESGVATCHYVQYDGSDDSMSTSAIDFTATDKMSVFAGVRKLSDAASIIAELSANASAIGNFGSFFLLSGTDSGGVYSSISRGSAAASAAQTAITTVGAAPDSAVLSATHDIAGDLSTIRRNAVAGTNGTADKGTGNFGNYPLFIGRRNNATAPFNGKDYGIIVVGKATSSTEITDTETWLAARTSGVSI